MSKYKKLAVNSIVFAIGNLGSKLISFILLPLYTYYLTKSEFGTVDLLTNTLSLLLPIFTLSVFDAILRFAMERGQDHKAVLTNALAVTLVGFLISGLLYPAVVIFFPFPKLIFFLYVLFFLQSINSCLSQFVRALGKVKLFSSLGMVGAFVVLISNILFLSILHWGIEGYIISLIISNFVCFIVVFIFGDIKKNVHIGSVNIGILRMMLLYSLPLIPNSLMWWIMSLSDRYVISFFLGVGANGLYAVASKIPNLLNVINSIFFQAWQMSAIEEDVSKDKSEFYTNIFSIYSTLLLIFTSVMIALTKFLMKFIVSAEYFESWRYVPFLLLGVVFSSFSSFVGTNYIANKNTAGIFKTSLWGAIINIVLNLILIPIIGINGAAISTMISFAIIWILRTKGTKKHVTIAVNLRKCILTLIILLLQILVLYSNLTYSYLLHLVSVVFIVSLSKKEVFLIYQKLNFQFKKKFNKNLGV